MDNKQKYDEFTKAIYESKGKANNSTIYNLINDFNCTAEDVKFVAEKTHNLGELKSLGQFRNNEHATRRMVHKCMYATKRDKRYPRIRPFRDYHWYFRYMPDEYLDEYFVSQDTMEKLLSFNNKTAADIPNDIFALYAKNQIYELVNGVNYPSETLLSGLKADNAELKDLFEPYDYKDVTFNYNATDFGMMYRDDNMSANHIVNYHYRNRDEMKPGSYEMPHTEAKTICKLLDSIAQIRILSAIMDVERKVEEGDDDKNFYSYSKYIFDGSRRTGVGRYNPEGARLELFGQVRSLEMLLDMGLGLYCTDRCGYVRSSNKKLVKRIQTAYKTFVKSKTVDDRKKMRKLLKRQLEVLINDFMGRSFYVRELKCVDEQDKAFLKGTNTVKTTHKMASGATEGKTFDLSKLAGAPTKTVEKARH